MRSDIDALAVDPAARTTGLVDVIVPTNRIGRFLPAALESARRQRYRPLRIFLVDDGSDDPEALDRLVADVPIATVIHRPPEGVSAARNAAIRSGTGEFVTFLDDDDLWPANRLDELVTTLRSHPEAGGVFGNGRYIDADGRVFGRWNTAAASQEDFLRRATPIPRITALLVRRDMLERVGLFDETLAFSEDDELILRLLRHAPLVSSTTTVVDYRRHGDNATLASWLTRYRSAHTAVSKNIAEAERLQQDEYAALLRVHLTRLKRSTAANSTGRVIGDLKARRVGAAVADVGQSLRIAPLAFARGVFRTIGSRIRSRLGSHPR